MTNSVAMRRTRRRRGYSPRKKPRAEAKARAAAAWHKMKGNGPFSGPEGSLYLRADVFEGTISVAEFKQGLRYLFDITGDEAFRTAELALDGYGLRRGGLKQATKQMLRDGHRSPEYAAVPFMKDGSVAEAERIAAEYGLPGMTGDNVAFGEVVARLRRAYLLLKKTGAATDMPDGHTGRTLIVRCAMLAPDGLGIVPDGRDWRRLIHDGHATLLRVMEKGASPQEIADALDHLRRREENLVRKSPKDS